MMVLNPPYIICFFLEIQGTVVPPYFPSLLSKSAGRV